MKDLYHFHPQLILRVPARSLSTPFTEAGLEASLRDEAFMEALYLASPVLHEECQKWCRGELTDVKRLGRLRNAVIRYQARSSRRCTPFGLFAGCAVIAWGKESRIELAPEQHARHTRLDMHYLCALAQHLAAQPTVRQHLRYWPNSSYYQLGDELRYIEQYYTQEQPVNQLSSLGASEAVLQVLAASTEGQYYSALVTLLAPEAAEQADAIAFLDALIEAQILVSELEPTVTGPEFMAHIQQVLARLHTKHPTDELAEMQAILTEVATQLIALDAQPTNTVARYQRILAALEPLGVPLFADKLFQTDALRGVASGAATLHEAEQAELLAALDVLACLSPPTSNLRLAEFTRQFEARYETCEVPLLEALDAESGLTYSAASQHGYSPLVHDLQVGGVIPMIHTQQYDEIQYFMHQKLRTAERNGQYAVELTPQELQHLHQPLLTLPPSLSIVFRPAIGGQVLLDSVAGSSAVNLLGRFAHAEPHIGQIVCEITEAEQRHNPAVAFAELCHLPSSRVGNILQRPAFRHLEIPYLAQSCLPYDRQVRVQDLTLRLHQGKLELRSRRTGQHIVPRLSTAHNYSLRALPVYELLCDLQTQGLQTRLGFSWRSVSLDARFLPRLTCGRVVLEAASWQLDRSEFAALLAAPPAEIAGCLWAMRQKWRLPRFFTFVEGDNELLIDADNSLLVTAWLDTIRSHKSIHLKECLLDTLTSPVRDSAGQSYAAQFIALLVRQGPCYTAASALAPVVAPMQRQFGLGSEWLYYKWYCGPVIAGRMLRETLAPLVDELRTAGIIDEWFFVRYADPSPHLRVRFHIPQVARIGDAVQLVSEYLSPCLANGYVWKSQTDTYQRELERYGPHTIELSERLFSYQSDAMLAYLTNPASPEEDDERYWLWGVQACDELLRAFDYSPAQQLVLLRSLQQAFAQEFNLNKELKLQIDSKYRRFRPALEQVLGMSSVPPEALCTLTATIKRAVATHPAGVSLDHLLRSYLHMLLNRLLPTDARLHELVLYDFLARHYQSVQQRQRALALN